MRLVFPPPGRDIVAPLGLAFTDGPGGQTILDGLAARAWPEGDESRRVSATVNGAGVAGFHKLPGVKFDPADPFAGAKRAFVVEVTDSLGRFQTGRVRVEAPAKGVVVVVMRSAAARTVTLARLAFRAELWDAANNRPAAFALLTVKVAGNGGATIASGLSDAAGRLLAVGDWPTPKVPVGAPPSRWDAPRPIVVEMQYNPAGTWTIPQFDGLEGLPAGRVWNKRGPDELYPPPDLTADRPAVVFRSAGDAKGRLLITSP